MKKIKILFKFNKSDKGCLIACLEMVLKTKQSDLSIRDFTKLLHKDQFGYDMQDVAGGLIKKGFEVEYGFFDEDVLGKKFQNDPLLPNLKKVLDEKKIHPPMVKYLKSTINFVRKYPKMIRVENFQPKDLTNYLDKLLPIIVHLSAKSLGADIEEEIHAVIVNGYDNKGFFIVNPPDIKEEHVKYEQFMKFWREAGKYFLVIKRG